MAMNQTATGTAPSNNGLFDVFDPGLYGRIDLSQGEPFIKGELGDEVAVSLQDRLKASGALFDLDYFVDKVRTDPKTRVLLKSGKADVNELNRSFTSALPEPVPTAPPESFDVGGVRLPSENDLLSFQAAPPRRINPLVPALVALIGFLLYNRFKRRKKR